MGPRLDLATGVGLLQGLLAIYGRQGPSGTARLEDGHIRFLPHDPEALPRTLGDVVIAGEKADPSEIRHEQRHVAQHQLLGPMYLPAVLASLLVPYERRPLERDAYQYEQPSHELLKQGPAGDIGRLLETLLKQGLD